MDLREFFLKQKKATRWRTQQALVVLRPEHFEWRPVAGALSVGEMLRHLWVSEEGVRRVALEADFSYYEKRIPGGLPAVIGTPQSLAHELCEIERVHQETLEQVPAFPLERLQENREYAAQHFSQKLIVMLYGINEHEVHHSAQLMTYLRMLGTPGPEPFVRPESPPRP
jgi:uncharacterized damage-inducible protein DinB